MVNDISIIWGIITVFVALGILLPFINEAYGETSANINIDNFESSVSKTVENASTINTFTVIFSILKMFFWTFGDLYFWLDGIFVILRVMLALTIARNVWIGGGG